MLHALQVCLSADCVALSGSMLAKMDMAVGPCDDFYQYACGTSIIDPLVPKHVLRWGTISKMAQWTDAVIKQVQNKPFSASVHVTPKCHMT